MPAPASILFCARNCKYSLRRAKEKSASTNCAVDRVAEPWAFKPAKLHTWHRTPARCESRGPRQQVMPDAQRNSRGGIDQGMPDLSTSEMPVTAWRSPTGGRPLFGRAGRLGRSGATGVHRSSLTEGPTIDTSSVTLRSLARCPYRQSSSLPVKPFCCLDFWLDFKAKYVRQCNWLAAKALCYTL